MKCEKEARIERVKRKKSPNHNVRVDPGQRAHSRCTRWIRSHPQGIPA